MTTKSQEAFEAWYLLEYGCISNGAHSNEKISFEAGAAYGRKAALEEAVALFNQPHVEHFGSSVVEMLEGLIK